MVPVAMHDQARVNSTREQLRQLRAQGFRYLRTYDDGDTWTGSNEVGIEIETLIRGEFLGQIVQGIAN